MSPTPENLISLAADAETLLELLESSTTGDDARRTQAVARAGMNAHALIIRCSQLLAKCELPGHPEG